MVNEKIRIGVLGCASIARRSMIPAIKESNRFTLVAVASRSKEKALSFSDMFQCEACVGYNSLLEHEDIQAIYIPLPTGLHKEWILKSLSCNKHVLAEKSIAFSHSEAKEMVSLARQKELVLMENYMFQYHPQHTIVRDWLDSGRIGEIRLFRSDFGFPPLPVDNFRYNLKIGGGALLDAAGYTVRALHFILGDDFTVKASTLYGENANKANIYGSAFLSNNSGIDAQLAFGMDHYYQCKYDIWGNKGKITAHWAFTPKADTKPLLELETATEKKLIEAPANNHFIGTLDAFAEAIQHQNPQDLYSQILTQSKTLEDIRNLSQLNIRNI